MGQILNAVAAGTLCFGLGFSPGSWAQGALPGGESLAVWILGALLVRKPAKPPKVQAKAEQPSPAGNNIAHEATRIAEAKPKRSLGSKRNSNRSNRGPVAVGVIGTQSVPTGASTGAPSASEPFTPPEVSEVAPSP